MPVTLFIDVKPAEAAQHAEIQVDGEPITGAKLELDKPRTVRVSVTAFGFRRATKTVAVGSDTTIEIELAKVRGKKSRTLPVTLGLGALGVIGWLLRRGR